MGEKQPVSIDAHPPERRRRSTTLLAHGCCCCCLHTVGGVIGAAFGSIRRRAPAPETLTSDEAIRAESEIKTANRYAAKVYWLALTLAVFGYAVVSTLLNPTSRESALFMGVFFLPIAQLGASVAALIWILIRPPARRTECLGRLGKITLFAFLGALAGCLGLAVTLWTVG